MPVDNETVRREAGWQEYRFRYLTHERTVQTATVYASDDETAAFLFNKAYSKHVKEML